MKTYADEIKNKTNNMGIEEQSVCLLPDGREGTYEEKRRTDYTHDSPYYKWSDDPLCKDFSDGPLVN